MNKTITALSRNVFLAAATLAVALLSAAMFLFLPMYAHAAILTQYLDVGMTNSDVTSLQTFLALDPNIYPQGLVTGYYGFLTKAAVSNFQSKNGIDPVGRVGPITMLAINTQMTNGGNVSTADGAGRVTYYGSVQPVLSMINVSQTPNSATFTWNSSIPATARVMYSTVWPFNYRSASSVTSMTGVANAQVVTLSNLQSGTTYYFVAESTDPQGNFTWSAGGNSIRTQ